MIATDDSLKEIQVGNSQHEDEVVQKYSISELKGGFPKDEAHARVSNSIDLRGEPSRNLALPNVEYLRKSLQENFLISICSPSIYENLILLTPKIIPK